MALVTGAIEYVGSAVVVKALEAGFNVRAAVHRPDAIDVLHKHEKIKSYQSKNDMSLTFAFVSDVVSFGSLTEVTVDCDYIVRAAGPLPERHVKHLMLAFVGVVRAFIQTAEATQSVRRVVLTDPMYETKRYVDTLPGSEMN